MFTGLVTDVGVVRSIQSADTSASADTRIVFETKYDINSIPLGASIACNGVCLTVVKLGEDWFAVDVSQETLSKTTLKDWGPGTRVNFERALCVGDELGGHIVSGHVDGTGKILSITKDGGSLRYIFEAQADLAPFIATKGSIAIDGVSLTVNSVEGATFGINIIPFTQTNTTFHLRHEGDMVNLEIDMLARYIARMREMSPS